MELTQGGKTQHQQQLLYRRQHYIKYNIYIGNHKHLDQGLIQARCGGKGSFLAIGDGGVVVAMGTEVWGMTISFGIGMCERIG